MMFWFDHGMSGWGYTTMAIAMVVFWILVVAGIVALVRFTTDGRVTRTDAPPVPYSESPERLLATRFARGEIDETEYRRNLGVLRQTPHQ